MVKDDNPVPNDLRQFILATIDSVAEMEALMLLRSGPEQGWSAPVFTRRLYISEQETAQLLKRLCEKGFAAAVASDPVQYRYQPGSERLGELVDRLVECYARHLVPVTNLIHSKPQARIREFADAFKFRKEP
jgi:hypothetical protein